SYRRTANSPESYAGAIGGETGDMISHYVRRRKCQPHFLLRFQRKAVNTPSLVGRGLASKGKRLTIGRPTQTEICTAMVVRYFSFHSSQGRNNPDARRAWTTTERYITTIRRPCQRRAESKALSQPQGSVATDEFH